MEAVSLHSFASVISSNLVIKYSMSLRPLYLGALK